MRNDRSNIIIDKVVEFSLLLIKYCTVLNQKKFFVIGTQLLRAGTSIGSNIFEAQNAESKADFVHKMKIAAKEASETLYWMTLCEKSDGFEFDIQLRTRAEELVRIISRIIATAKNKN